MSLDEDKAEWTAWLAHAPETRKEKLTWARDEVDSDGYTDLRLLAGKALYGQPFGFTKDHLDALLTLIFNATGAASCPVCGGGEWKMSAPPICAGCGFRPKPKGAYLALAKEATDRIARLLPPREKAE